MSSPSTFRRRKIHDSTAPLESVPKAQWALRRVVGVTATRYFHIGRGRLMVDVEIAYPEVVGAVAGRNVEVDEAGATVREMERRLADDCERIARELSEHARRLRAVIAQSVRDEIQGTPAVPRRVADLLSLVDGEGRAPEWWLERIAGASDEDLEAADEWAGAVHLSASDNDDVDVPPAPAFLEALFAGRAT